MRQAQTCLIDLGYLDDTADGKFGSKTERAVKAFQRTIGARQNGRLTDEQQTQLLILWGDVTGITEGDGLSDEELRALYPDGCCRTGDGRGDVEYCWRHREAGRLIEILLMPNLPDRAVATAAERAVNLWTAHMYGLFDEWARISSRTAREQRLLFEDALAEVVPDLNEAHGPGSAAAQRALAFWLQAQCVDRCFDLHTAEGSGK